MVFAVLDYVRYKFRRENYGDVAMRAAGGRLAIAENFADWDRLGSGHIFMYHGAESFLSWLVMYFTSSVWSHTGMFTEHGHIVVATTGGVVEHPFSDYFDGRSYMAILTFRHPLSADESGTLVASLRKEVGCGFNWRGIWRLFFHIVLGADASYRIRFSVDILIALAMLAPLILVSSVFALILPTLAGLYVVAVLVNAPKRAHMRHILAAQGIPT